MNNINVIGLDLAKNVFQVHAVDKTGRVVKVKQLKRAQVLPFFSRIPSCTVGMEACGGAHYWARELTHRGPSRAPHGCSLCQTLCQIQQERPT